MLGSHSRRLLAGIVCAALAAFAAAAVIGAAPATLRAASGDLLSARAQAARLADEVAALDARIDRAVRDCSSASDALHEVRAHMQGAQRELRTNRTELRAAQAALAARAVALYKQDDISTLDAVLSAGDFADMVGQLSLVRSVARADRRMLRDVETARQRLERRARRLADDARTAQQLVARRDRQLAAARAQLADRQALLDGTRADVRRLAAQQAAPSPAPVAEPSAPSGGDPGGGQDQGGQDQGGHSRWWPLIEQAAGVYGVSARGMERLMMIESGGSATVVGPGGYYGLFQYAPGTWKGSWNPYRAHAITDGAAQIRATALALKLGYGHAFWDPSYSWAFGGG